MIDELREAVERTRRVHAGETVCDVYGRVYLDDSWKRFAADNKVIAAAYLADHPADDAEPVTKEWLLSVGFDDRRNGVSMGLGLRVNGGPHLYCSCNAPGVTPDWYFDDGRLIACNDLLTRGHVRRLCAALGVPLTGSVSTPRPA